MEQFFNRIIGIDQTGALDSRGQFKPLYGVTLSLNRSGKVSSFKAELLPTLDLNQWRNQSGRTLIVVDSVLGMPKSLLKKNESIRDLFLLTKKHKCFGLKAGQVFFSGLYRDRMGVRLPKKVSNLELRECDRIADANSLFRSMPYQRNVQTGTFRVWHELSKQLLHDVAIWPFDSVSKQTLVLAEGYPKLFRNMRLPDCSSFDDPNFRDAARLAWGARNLMLKNPYFLKSSRSKEGGILSP